MNVTDALSSALKRGNYGYGSSMADVLYEAIKEMIISGKLPKDYCFPNETVLCKELGIGRTTIREAYKALAAGGYITRSKRGTVVNGTEEISASLPLSTAIQLSEFNDMIEFRSLLESRIAGLAAERATAEQIQHLRFLIGEMVNHKDNLNQLTYYDTEFHMALAAMTQNKLIERIMSMAEETFSSVMFQSYCVDTERNIKEAIPAHNMILDTICAHDSQSAEAAMYSHILTIKQRGISVDQNTISDPSQS